MPIKINDILDAFASFAIKIKDVHRTVKINENVYNGRKLMNSGNKIFMDTQIMYYFTET